MEEQQTTTTTTEELAEVTTTSTGLLRIELNRSNSEIDGIPDNSENIIHQLFAELGCNLDYTPQNTAQAFTMTLQFAAALWFIWWFIKYLFTVMKQLFTVGR